MEVYVFWCLSSTFAALGLISQQFYEGLFLTCCYPPILHMEMMGSSVRTGEKTRGVMA